MELLTIRNLRISFRTANGKVQAVRGLDLDLRRGETLAIVGESGSGKSVTARSLLGILAPNALVESGEIIYNGTDILKADESYMQRIRGEKIAMIFQDPLSSLNPIVKIGKQLTEAMIIKGKERRNKARKAFNALLKQLNVSADISDPSRSDENKRLCREFDEFAILHVKLEFAYETARECAEYALLKLDEIAVLDGKKLLDQKSRKKAARELTSLLRRTKNEYVVKDGASLDQLIGQLKNSPLDALTSTISDLLGMLREGLEIKPPDFFYVAFCRLHGDPYFEARNIDEWNSKARAYLVEKFMSRFEDMLRRASVVEYARSVGHMRRVVELLSDGGKLQAELQSQKPGNLALKLKLRAVHAAVERSKNRFDAYKDSRVYSFRLAITAAIEKYFGSIKYNKKLRRKQGDSDGLLDEAALKNAISDICGRLSELYSRNISDADSGAVTGAENSRVIDIINTLKADAGDYARVVTKQSAKFRAIKLMDEVGISEPQKRFNQYPFEFSGGMRQRIVIAIALSADPEILICDEPTTALDVTIQGQILELINKLKERRNISVLFITHDLGVVANMADNVAVMYAGKIVEKGSAEDVFYNPLHPYMWALLSSMPDLDTTAALEAIPGTPPNMIHPPTGDAFAARNKYALKIDFEEQPPLVEVSETHSAATWLLHPNAPKVTPPAIVTERIERALKKTDEPAGQED